MFRDLDACQSGIDLVFPREKERRGLLDEGHTIPLDISYVPPTSGRFDFTVNPVAAPDRCDNSAGPAYVRDRV
jgi:hypothetical protein